MAYRPHNPSAPLLFGYDPERDLPQNHLARLVERVVEESLLPPVAPVVPGQPAFDPRLCAKVLLYGYATGIRSSRQLQRLCEESLPYLYLTRGDTPSYRTLCAFRVHQTALLETVWTGMFAIAQEVGISRLGRIVVDSSKIRANASPEAVVRAAEFEAVLTELRTLLQEAAQADAAEENLPPGATCVDKTVDTVQMRDILRRVRKQQAASHNPLAQAASPTQAAPLGPRMRPRLEAAIQTLEAAQQEERKHACLTDPDARMMGEGREKGIRECHSYEVAVDNGLLVAAQTTNSSHDAARLSPLVEAAQLQEPIQLTAIDADSGYYTGDTIAALLAEGVDVCIPDNFTACDLHRQQPVGSTRAKVVGSVAFTYTEPEDTYTCPEGMVLLFRQQRPRAGQEVRVYQARQACPSDCPLAAACGASLTRKRRMLTIRVNHETLQAHLQRFSDPAHVERYRSRAPAVETVFGFVRAVLGYSRWLLRGAERVRAEARLFTAAYQLRKVHYAWSTRTK